MGMRDSFTTGRDTEATAAHCELDNGKLRQVEIRICVTQPRQSVGRLHWTQQGTMKNLKKKVVQLTRHKTSLFCATLMVFSAGCAVYPPPDGPYPPSYHHDDRYSHDRDRYEHERNEQARREQERYEQERRERDHRRDSHQDDPPQPAKKEPQRVTPAPPPPPVVKPVAPVQSPKAPTQPPPAQPRPDDTKKLLKEQTDKQRAEEQEKCWDKATREWKPCPK